MGKTRKRGAKAHQQALEKRARAAQRRRVEVETSPEALQEVCERLAAAEAEAGALRARRDELIEQLKDSHSWRSLAGLTGTSRQALMKRFPGR